MEDFNKGYVITSHPPLSTEVKALGLSNQLLAVLAEMSAHPDTLQNCVDIIRWLRDQKDRLDVMHVSSNFCEDTRVQEMIKKFKPQPKSPQ